MATLTTYYDVVQSGESSPCGFNGWKCWHVREVAVDMLMPTHFRTAASAQDWADVLTVARRLRTGVQ